VVCRTSADACLPVELFTLTHVEFVKYQVSIRLEFPIDIMEQIGLHP